jgi:hypothetical protein
MSATLRPAPPGLDIPHSLLKSQKKMGFKVECRMPMVAHKCEPLYFVAIP